MKKPPAPRISVDLPTEIRVAGGQASMAAFSRGSPLALRHRLSAALLLAATILDPFPTMRRGATTNLGRDPCPPPQRAGSFLLLTPGPLVRCRKYPAIRDNRSPSWQARRRAPPK